MRDRDGAIASWRTLPRQARRQALELAEREEPHPDQAVATTARAYARARLAGRRRALVVLPVLAVAAAFAAPPVLVVAHPAGWLRDAVLVLPCSLALLVVAGWSLACGQWQRGRLRKLAATVPAEPGQLVVRLRKPRRVSVPFVVQLVAGAASPALLQLGLGPVSYLLIFGVGFTVPLAYQGLVSWLRVRRGVPGPAAFVIGADGIELLPGEQGRRHAGRDRSGGDRQTLAWAQLARIVVLDPEPGSRRQESVLALIDRERDGSPFPIWPQASIVPPLPWARNNLGPFVLEPAQLDMPAEQILAAVTAHAPVPVEHRTLPDPRRGGRASGQGAAALRS